MTSYFKTSFLLLFALTLNAQSAVNEALEPTWTLSGSFVRDVIIIGSLYEVKFYVGDLDANLDRYLAQGPKATCEIDTIADYFLDPQNSVPIKVDYEILSSQKSYGRERESLVAGFKRAGFEFSKEETWEVSNAKDSPGDQDDVYAYVDGMIGRAKDKLAAPHQYRTVGDMIRLLVGPTDRGGYEPNLVYIPAAKNTDAKKAIKADQVTTLFKGHRVILGMISTFISKKHCNPDFKEKMPQATMKGVVELCKKKHT